MRFGSLTSELARATAAPYTVAKGGIKMLTKAMTAERGELGIQANAIGPGWVKGRTPARRWGKPEELAGTAVFLTSSAANYVNGQIIQVDGGMISVL